MIFKIPFISKIQGKCLQSLVHSGGTLEFFPSERLSEHELVHATGNLTNIILIYVKFLLLTLFYLLSSSMKQLL